MGKPCLAFILGIRPDVIRASLVLNSIRKRTDFDVTFIWSGQHYSDNLKDVFFRELNVATPEIELELDAARLWHWRARTTVLQALGNVELPESYSTFEQLVGATAMRGYEQGLLPSPLRGDFRAYGKAYRQLSETEHAEALSIAYERHRALAWLGGAGRSWDGVSVDT